MRKKVLFLITKSNWGGAQRYVFDLATGLDSNVYDCMVALGGNGELVERLHAHHIDTITIPTLARDISLIKEWQSFRALYHIVKEANPDILHINSSKAGLMGSLVGRLCGVPRIIFTAHGWAFNEKRPMWQRILIRMFHWLTVLLSHTTIAVSETTRRQLRMPLPAHKMVVVHNGIAPIDFYSRDVARQFFTQRMPHLNAYYGDTWSVTIGELHDIKRHDLVIRALSAIVGTHPHVRHIIIGDGEMRQQLKNLVHELNLEDHVFFAGAVPDAARYLKAFDFFVLASRSEALAYVILEACAAGLPIIASNVGGIPEIIMHEHIGLLFPPGDAHMLAEHISTVIDNPEIRENLGNAVLTRAHDFTLQTMREKTVAVYTII